MNELDKLMEQYEPISSPLPEDELRALRKRVLAGSRPKKKSCRLMIALAACICLLAACGVIAAGLFDSMTHVNQTSLLVEKYGQVLEDPPSVTVDGHTLTWQAIIRSDSVARIIYDITGSQQQTNDWISFRDEAEDRWVLRVQPLTNGQPAGHTEELPGIGSSAGRCQLRQSGPIGKVSETGSTRYFADLDLTEGADTISLYVLSEDGTAEVLQAALPEPAAEKCSALPDVIYPVSTNDGQADYIFQQVTITPFRIILEGVHEDASMSLLDDGPDWYSLIHLYDAEGEEIQIGKDGSFYTASGSLGPEDFTVTLGSYDLIDPEKVAEIEINKERFPLE